MTGTEARESARDILRIVPLVMRSVVAELRGAGELPAPAHFGLLTVLAAQPRPLTLTELAALQGVSLPTMSNSITALVRRGWVRRTVGADDRRQTRIAVTTKGRDTVGRVGRSAEAHLAERLTNLDETVGQRLHDGLQVLRQVFADASHCTPAARLSRPARQPSRRRRSPAEPASRP